MVGEEMVAVRGEGAVLGMVGVVEGEGMVGVGVVEGEAYTKASLRGSLDNEDGNATQFPDLQ